MSKTTKELLEEARSLRLSFKKNDGAPVGKIPPPLPWIQDFFQALAPVGYRVRDCVIHFYYDEYPTIPAEKAAGPNITVIIHGHTRTGFCSAGTLCHVQGFNPKELTEVPSHFNNSWKRFKYESDH